MQFNISTNDVMKYSDWLVEHNKKCVYHDDGTKPYNPVGAIGGRITYSFTQTSLGVITKVICACGEEIDLADYKSW